MNDARFVLVVPPVGGDYSYVAGIYDFDTCTLYTLYFETEPGAGDGAFLIIDKVGTNEVTPLRGFAAPLWEQLTFRLPAQQQQVARTALAAVETRGK